MCEMKRKKKINNQRIERIKEIGIIAHLCLKPVSIQKFSVPPCLILTLLHVSSYKSGLVHDLHRKFRGGFEKGRGWKKRNHVPNAKMSKMIVLGETRGRRKVEKWSWEGRELEPGKELKYLESKIYLETKSR